MTSLAKPVSVSALTLEQLFPGKLTDTVCVNLHYGREVWVATLMCAEYLESFVDSIIIRDDSFTPIGILGGIELLDNLRKNPMRDFQYSTKVSQIMLEGLGRIESGTRLADLLQTWKKTGRAFSIIMNEFGDCSTISARRMVELGARCRTELSVKSMRRNKILSFRKDATLGEILDLMYRNRVRKLLLEDSSQFISDRIILSEISKILRFQPEVDSFSDLPVSQFKLAEAHVMTDDLNFSQVCAAMQAMDHPLIVYENTVLTPWDVSFTLLSDEVTLPDAAAGLDTCPHCGMVIG